MSDPGSITSGSEEHKKITYPCPICKEKREVMINRIVHLRNAQLRDKGVVNYYDIHFSPMYGIHACKLVIDASLTLRGYYAVESLVPEKVKSGIPMVIVPYNHQVMNLGEGLEWKHWKEIVITFAMEKRILRVVGVRGEPELIPMVEEEDSDDFEVGDSPRPENVSVDRVVSTALTVSVDWACEKKYSESLYYWFKALADILQMTDNLSNERVIDLLQFIDSKADRAPRDREIMKLQYITYFNSLLLLFKGEFQEQVLQVIMEHMRKKGGNNVEEILQGLSANKGLMWEGNDFKELIGGTVNDIVELIVDLEEKGFIETLVPHVISSG